MINTVFAYIYIKGFYIIKDIILKYIIYTNFYLIIY